MDSSLDAGKRLFVRHSFLVSGKKTDQVFSLMQHDSSHKVNNYSNLALDAKQWYILHKKKKAENVQGRKPVGDWKTEGKGGGLRAGSGQWKEDQRLSGSHIKVPLNGRALWCPLCPISVTRQMLAVKSNKFQPPCPRPQDILPICFDSPSCNKWQIYAEWLEAVSQLNFTPWVFCQVPAPWNIVPFQHPGNPVVSAAICSRLCLGLQDQ